MIAGIFVVGCLILLGGYVIYGRFLERQFDVDPSRKTPAVTMTDNVDYVPAKAPVLFGHHFSSIAGAGPIVGPITAALAFGWLPAFLWIIIGSIFIGGTHDFAALITSIRHKARSVGEVCRLYLSPMTYKLFLAFVWLALVYVLIVFLDLTASTFAPNLAAIADAAVKAELRLDGGAVASASLIYIGLALLFGIFVNSGKINLKTGSLIFVPLVFIALFFSRQIPVYLPGFIEDSASKSWSLILLAYCFAASIMPVWLLLQPRDYLSSFLLYACVLFGGIGLVITSVTGKIVSNYPAFIGFSDPNLGFIFPALFITIACGAVSGFHAIVASGTTAKQLPSESSARPVTYGSMLVEAVLGIMALGTVMFLVKPVANTNPNSIFAQGMGQFLNTFHVPVNIGAGFGLLAISTFLLTTLDTCTRLARYIFEEMFNVKGSASRYISTALTLALPLALVFYDIPDPTNPGATLAAWKAVWPVFGATNQLLAAMALLVVFVWRTHQKKPAAFVAIPMVLMMATAGAGLVQKLIAATCGKQVQPLIAGLSALLLLMAVVLLIDVIRSWGRIKSVKIPEEEEEPRPVKV